MPDQPVQPTTVNHEAANPAPALDRILESAKKYVAERGAAPAAPTAPEAPATIQPATLSPDLASRAQELGWTQAEALAIGDHSAIEKAVGAAERTLLRSLRKQETKEPEKVQDSIWKDDEEKALFDPRYQALIERQDKRYQDKVSALENQVKQMDYHIREQAALRGRTKLDSITDKLAEKGYADVYGKGPANPGTPQWEHKGKIAALLGGQVQLYAQQGIVLTDEQLDQEAESIAKRLHGERQKAPVSERQAPPKNPNTGRFEKQTQFTISRTPTNRPTQQEAPPEQKGREAAVRAARGFYEANGSPMHDIHDE